MIEVVRPRSHRDGRTARAERTRDALVKALLSLLNDGNLRPTAREVAERGSISLRSVFQHFEDMESLYAALADAQMELLSRFVSQETGEGPVEARLMEFVERRAKLLDTITPVRRAALLQEPFSEVLARRLRWAHELARDELKRVFAPELEVGEDAEGKELLWALDAASNWAAWDTLRRQDGLSVEESKRVMLRMVRALLSEAA